MICKREIISAADNYVVKHPNFHQFASVHQFLSDIFFIYPFTSAFSFTWRAFARLAVTTYSTS